MVSSKIHFLKLPFISNNRTAINYHNTDTELEMFIWTNGYNNLCFDSLLPVSSRFLKNRGFQEAYKRSNYIRIIGKVAPRKKMKEAEEMANTCLQHPNRPTSHFRL